MNEHSVDAEWSVENMARHTRGLCWDLYVAVNVNSVLML
jgi:hypothetical protein